MQRILLILFTMSGLQALAYDHPGGMHPQTQLRFVKKMVQEKRQPYYAAYLQLMVYADSAFLGEDRAVPDFHVPGYYIDPVGHEKNSLSLATDALSAYACALAYQLNGDKKYAARALRILNAWAKKNTTYSGYDGNLVMTYTGTALIMAGELLYNYKGWKSKERDVYLSWVRNVYQKCANEIRGKKNNWGDWGRFGSVLAAHLLDDPQEMEQNIRLIQSDLFRKIEEDGHMPEETRRKANSIWYTYFSLAPITAAAWVVAQSGGVDLFELKEGNRSLKGALDYLYYYNRNPGQWPWYTDPVHGSATNWPGNLFEAMTGVYGEGKYQEYVQPARPVSHAMHHYAWVFPTLMITRRGNYE